MHRPEMCLLPLESRCCEVNRYMLIAGRRYRRFRVRLLESAVLPVPVAMKLGITHELNNVNITP